MDTNYNLSYELQRDLDDARSTLVVLNDSIKRIVGRSKSGKDFR